MKSYFFLILSFLFSIQARAQLLTRQPDFTGLVEIANGQKIYCVQYQALQDAPTVVFLHGLTYTTKPWQTVAQDLADRGFGVLLYDMRGMGKTLEESGPVKETISLQQQVDDLAQLLAERQLTKVELAGLSYGGAVGLAFTAQYPQNVDKLILMAPYVKALKTQDDAIKQKIKLRRLMNPMDRRTDDELYDEYLKAMIFQTYPIYEPVINEHPYRLEAVYNMVRGVRKFKAVDIVKSLPAGKIHLVMAGKDQYVPAADHQEFWNALQADQKLTRISVRGAEHKLPEVVPHFLGGWIELIAENDARLTPGSDFVGTPADGSAVSSTTKIVDLPKDTQRGFYPGF